MGFSNYFKYFSYAMMLGQVAAIKEEAQQPDSPGGKEITVDEANNIGVQTGLAIKGAFDLVGFDDEKEQAFIEGIRSVL